MENNYNCIDEMEKAFSEFSYTRGRKFEMISAAQKGTRFEIRYVYGFEK